MRGGHKGQAGAGMALPPASTPGCPLGSAGGQGEGFLAPAWPLRGLMLPHHPWSGFGGYTWLTRARTADITGAAP